jgi:molybdate transport system permease protein
MEALWLSLGLAACVAAILLLLGTPLAYWISQTTWRGKFLFESIVAMPLVLPPTVLGFYLLVAMGSNGPLGKLWISWFGHTLAFTFSGLVVASVLYSLPFAVQPLVAGFESVDRRLLDAAAVLGAGRWRTFREIILPLCIPAVITAAVLSFAHTLGEFGVVLMVGGNIPGVTRTVSIDIYDRVQSLDYGSANRLSIALLFISFAVLTTIYAANRKVWSLWPSTRGE